MSSSSRPLLGLLLVAVDAEVAELALAEAGALGLEVHEERAGVHAHRRAEHRQLVTDRRSVADAPPPRSSIASAAVWYNSAVVFGISRPRRSSKTAATIASMSGLPVTRSPVSALSGTYDGSNFFF